MSRYTLWALFGPSSWTIWCLIVAAAGLMWRSSRSRRLVQPSVYAGLIAAAVTMVLPTGHVILEPLEQRFPLVSPDRIRADNIIVLAGGEKLTAAYRSGRPQYSEHNERVTEGAILAIAHPGSRLWAVGGVRRPANGPYDVDWDIRTWRELGVPAANIRRIANTLDTCSNARGVAQHLPRGASIVLVTSAFHMPRSIGCFRQAGLDPLAYPVDFQNGPQDPVNELLKPDVSGNLHKLDIALHEYVGLAYYRIAGRITELWPGPRPALTRSRSKAASA